MRSADKGSREAPGSPARPPTRHVWFRHRSTRYGMSEALGLATVESPRQALFLARPAQRKPPVSHGLSALGAGLSSLGIPTDSIVEYETALKSDHVLVMAYGTRQEVAEATRLLAAAEAARVAAYRATLPRETLAHGVCMHGNSC